MSLPNSTDDVSVCGVKRNADDIVVNTVHESGSRKRDRTHRKISSDDVVASTLPASFNVRTHTMKRINKKSAARIRNVWNAFDSIPLEGKSDDKIEKKISLDLSNNPDLAQTIVVTCLGLEIDCDLYGLQTLKIKETDRLRALKSEIEKFGVDKIEITESSLHLENKSQLKSNISIDTYDDHRMAMSFVPLSLLDPIKINDPLVVTKSYVSFWDHLEKLGFEISKNK